MTDNETKSPIRKFLEEIGEPISDEPLIDWEKGEAERTKRIKKEKRQSAITRTEAAGIVLTEDEKATLTENQLDELRMGFKIHPPPECCSLLLPRLRKRMENIEKSVQQEEEKDPNIIDAILLTSQKAQLEHTRNLLGQLTIICKTGDVIQAHETERFAEVMLELKQREKKYQEEELGTWK